MNIDAVIQTKKPLIRYRINGELFDIPANQKNAIPEDARIVEQFDGYLAGFSDAGRWEPSGFKSITEAFKYLDEQTHEPDTAYAVAVDELYDYLLDSIDPKFEYKVVRANGTVDKWFVKMRPQGVDIYEDDNRQYHWKRKAKIRAIELAEERGCLNA